MTIRYSYISNVKYEPLADGHVNWHHIDSMQISGEADVHDFLRQLSENSQVGNITNLEYSINA